MKSFWFPTSQCLETPQMYHFFPGVARVITSFPLVKASVPAGATQSWKPVPLTLSTLWEFCVYLKTAPTSQISSITSNETKIQKIFKYFIYIYI